MMNHRQYRNGIQALADLRPEPHRGARRRMMMRRIYGSRLD
jgi:hypothetical protein